MSNPPPPQYSAPPSQYPMQDTAKPQINMSPPIPPPMQQQNSYPMQQAMPQPGMQPAPSAAQIGEQYRAQLFAQCAQGIHDPKTKYGMCGIITAVMCFPCGLICLFSDTESRCNRCGIRLDK